MTHARLAIVDLGDRNDQPMTVGSTTCVFAGELWNKLELARSLGDVDMTDAETICRVFDEKGIEGLAEIEGMFAAVFLKNGIMVGARDVHGEVPLHFDGRTFATTMREAGTRCDLVSPGTWVSIDERSRTRHGTFREIPNIRSRLLGIEESSRILRRMIVDSIRERCAASDVGGCFLVSGGADSTAVVTAWRELNPSAEAFGYVACLAGRESKDLRTARSVAERFDIRLTEVAVEPPTAGDLSSMVRAIEMSSVPQVEIAWLCDRIAERAAADGHRVVYSGEGADELFGSYEGFAFHGIRKHGWHAYRRRLFVDQHRKNFPRCNKVFMRRGIECRLPFLSSELVPWLLSLEKPDVATDRDPKAVLKRAFPEMPPEVSGRKKAAFQVEAGVKTSVQGIVSNPKKYLNCEAKKLPAPGWSPSFGIVVVSQAPSAVGGRDDPFAGRPGKVLSSIFGDDWIDRCDRINLVPSFAGPGKPGKGDRWFPKMGKYCADAIIDRLPSCAVILGKNAWASFGFSRKDEWFKERTKFGTKFVLMPHPSGVHIILHNGGIRREMRKTWSRLMNFHRTVNGPSMKT